MMQQSLPHVLVLLLPELQELSTFPNRYDHNDLLTSSKVLAQSTAYYGNQESLTLLQNDVVSNTLSPPLTSPLPSSLSGLQFPSSSPELHRVSESSSELVANLKALYADVRIIHGIEYMMQQLQSGALDVSKDSDATEANSDDNNAARNATDAQRREASCRRIITIIDLDAWSACEQPDIVKKIVLQPKFRERLLPIVISSDERPESMWEQIALGALDYLVKPLSLNTLKTLWLIEAKMEAAASFLSDESIMPSAPAPSLFVTHRQPNFSESNNPEMDPAISVSGVTIWNTEKRFADIISTYYSPFLVVDPADFPSACSEDKRMELLASLDDWHFDAQRYCDEDLLRIVQLCFETVNVYDTLHTTEKLFSSFCLTVKANYRQNPYHNFCHAVDVLQASYRFLKSQHSEKSIGVDMNTKRVDEKGKPIFGWMLSIDDMFSPGSVGNSFRPLDRIALLIASYCHDVGHPGVNNFFEVNAQSPLALLYSDKSVLESYHSSLAFSILRDENCNILSQLEPKDYNDFRTTVVTAILATDMACHFDYIGRIKDRVNKARTESKYLSTAEKDDRNLLSAMLLKCADISNVARPFQIAKRWADVLMEEFFAQGDLELKLGYPVFPLANRNTVTKPDSQVEFINRLACPLFDSLREIMPAIDYCSDVLRRNVYEWENIKQQMTAEAEAAKLNAEKSAASATTAEAGSSTFPTKSDTPIFTASNIVVDVHDENELNLDDEEQFVGEIDLKDKEELTLHEHEMLLGRDRVEDVVDLPRRMRRQNSDAFSYVQAREGVIDVSAIDNEVLSGGGGSGSGGVSGTGFAAAVSSSFHPYAYDSHPFSNAPSSMNDQTRRRYSVPTLPLYFFPQASDTNTGIDFPVRSTATAGQLYSSAHQSQQHHQHHQHQHQHHQPSSLHQSQSTQQQQQSTHNHDHHNRQQPNQGSHSYYPPLQSIMVRSTVSNNSSPSGSPSVRRRHQHQHQHQQVSITHVRRRGSVGSVGIYGLTWSRGNIPRNDWFFYPTAAVAAAAAAVSSSVQQQQSQQLIRPTSTTMAGTGGNETTSFNSEASASSMPSSMSAIGAAATTSRILTGTEPSGAGATLISDSALQTSILSSFAPGTSFSSSSNSNSRLFGNQMHISSAIQEPQKTSRSDGAL